MMEVVVAEWLGASLEMTPRRFDSGPRLHRSGSVAEWQTQRS